MHERRVRANHSALLVLLHLVDRRRRRLLLQRRPRGGAIWRGCVGRHAGPCAGRVIGHHTWCRCGGHLRSDLRAVVLADLRAVVLAGLRAVVLAAGLCAPRRNALRVAPGRCVLRPQHGHVRPFPYIFMEIFYRRDGVAPFHVYVRVELEGEVRAEWHDVRACDCPDTIAGGVDLHRARVLLRRPALVCRVFVDGAAAVLCCHRVRVWVAVLAYPCAFAAPVALARVHHRVQHGVAQPLVLVWRSLKVGGRFWRQLCGDDPVDHRAFRRDRVRLTPQQYVDVRQAPFLELPANYVPEVRPERAVRRRRAAGQVFDHGERLCLEHFVHDVEAQPRRFLVEGLLFDRGRVLRLLRVVCGDRRWRGAQGLDALQHLGPCRVRCKRDEVCWVTARAAECHAVVV